MTVKVTHFLFSLFILVSLHTTSSQAQSIEILGGNTLNGVIQGTALGSATMALANSTDFAPLRVGVGLGIIYGVGVGVYDLNTAGTQSLLVRGTFNNGDNTTIIVLLDTIYGAVAGAVIVTAGTLVANEPIVTGLQYGAGIGAWLGFGFGIFDAFVLSKREPGGVIAGNRSTTTPSGLLTFTSKKRNMGIGLVSPSINQRVFLDQQNLRSSLNFGVDVLKLNIRF